MAKRILVVGRNTFESGKTTFAAALANELVSIGAKTEYFKPISAHNYSERLAHTKECVKQGRLFSFDLATVSKIVKSSVDSYIANPVHRLYVPAKEISEVTKQQFGTLGLAGLDAVIAMERLSRPTNQNPESVMLVARDLVEQGKLLITKSETEALMGNMATIDVGTLEEVQEIEAQRIEDNLTLSLKVIEEGAECVLIESFNDSVWPWERLDSVDAVAVVSPGEAKLYDSDRFRKAALLRKHRHLPIRAVDFTRIMDIVKPLKRMNWEKNAHDGLLEEMEIDF